jgi:uncharacterized membrane protein
MPASRRRIEFGMVLAAMVLVTTLSLLDIGRKSLWIDEASSVFLVRGWSQMWQRLTTYDGNMWLYYTLLHFWVKLGDSEGWTRGLSALFAIASVPAIYLLGRRLLRPRAATIATILLAVNPFFIRYAQEARSYTLAVLLAILSSYFFIQAVDRPSRRHWIIHGVCAGLGIYAHFFMGLVYLAQLASLPFLGRKRISWTGAAVSVAATVALVLPLFFLAPFVEHALAWIQPPTLYSILDLFRVVTGSWPLLCLYFAFCTVAFLGVARRPAREPADRQTWQHLFIAIWAVLPILLIYVFSVVVTPLFVKRYLIVCLPAMALLAAAGISRLPRSWMQFATLGLILCLSARGLHWWYTGHGKDDWRAATRFVQAEGRPGDAVIFYWYTGKRAFEYYLDHADGSRTPLVPLELAPWVKTGRNARHELDMELLDALPTTYDRVWLVLSSDTAIDVPDRSIILQTVETHYDRLSDHAFRHIRVLQFQKTPL